MFLKAPEKNSTTITILVDNTASGNLTSEHGLSFWIEYSKKQVLFDAGQTGMIVKNAKLLDINLADTDSIVLSHGHYDHTGGLSAVLDIAPKAVVYLHPAALKPKFSKKSNRIRTIGISDSIKKIILNRSGGKKVIWTEIPTEIPSGLFVTGQIPRITNFEDTDSSFFVDENCQKADILPDDQAIFFNSKKGLVVLLGCAHSGVVNTLNYVAKLSGKSSIHTIIGGMHLSNASLEKLENTIAAFNRYKVQKIGIAHCTGTKAIKKFEEAFGKKCFVCSVGKRIELE